MKTRLNTFRLGQKLGAGAWGQTAAFTLVELLVVIAIVALLAGAILPAVGSFFDTARGPNAQNLISASLTNARNYAVANNITTTLRFSDDDEGDTYRTLMSLTEGASFTDVPGFEPRHLPDNIVISSNNNPSSLNRSVDISFLASGQLTQTGSSVTDFYVFDTVGSGDPEELEHLYINYYSGAVIEE